jgi:hypothetical protein
LVGAALSYWIKVGQERTDIKVHVE